MLALLTAHHILHVSRIRVNLAKIGDHMLHVSRIRVKSHLPSASIIRRIRVNTIIFIQSFLGVGRGGVSVL